MDVLAPRFIAAFSGRVDSVSVMRPPGIKTAWDWTSIHPSMPPVDASQVNVLRFICNSLRMASEAVRTFNPHSTRLCQFRTRRPTSATWSQNPAAGLALWHPHGFGQDLTSMVIHDEVIHDEPYHRVPPRRPACGKIPCQAGSEQQNHIGALLNGIPLSYGVEWG
jgi:hypothetical protein